mmetsp:Transcript_3481/g.6347  ORF Transcript_3481/g.6347 Transcript_3481/m.6347 type:complete len:139 (-) Transcript_3481:30-446(-)
MSQSCHEQKIFLQHTYCTSSLDGNRLVMSWVLSLPPILYYCSRLCTCRLQKSKADNYSSYFIHLQTHPFFSPFAGLIGFFDSKQSVNPNQDVSLDLSFVESLLRPANRGHIVSNDKSLFCNRTEVPKGSTDGANRNIV